MIHTLSAVLCIVDREGEVPEGVHKTARTLHKHMHMRLYRA